MVQFYVKMIKAGILTIDNVPEGRKDEVESALNS